MLNLVPALFHPNLDIRERVTRAGEPFVGGEGNAMVNTPTCPCMANIYIYVRQSSCLMTVREID